MRPPCEHSCRWSLALLATHVESLVFLKVFLGELCVEMGVDSVHARVATLSERGVLLVSLRGRRLGHLALKTFFKFVERIQTGVVPVNRGIDRLLV